MVDPTDGKHVHLDRLNLSHAWMLEGIVVGLPEDNDDCRPTHIAAAAVHWASGLASVPAHIHQMHRDSPWLKSLCYLKYSFSHIWLAKGHLMSKNITYCYNILNIFYLFQSVHLSVRMFRTLETAIWLANASTWLHYHGLNNHVVG